ncbi:MAG: hypothetical protein VW576_04300 [Opitutae bacterium]
MRAPIKIPAVLWFVFLSLAIQLWSNVELEVRNKSYFSVRDFKRIPEFFRGEEYEGWKVYCRSRPNEREGFYFVVKVDGSLKKLPQGVHWALDWIVAPDPMAQSIKIPIDNKEILGKEVFIGLTGQDWPDPSAKPLAWRLCLVGGEGDTIAKSQSFLWSK